MDEYGIFQGEDLIFTIGGKERAEEMVKRYPGATIAPVIEKNRKWVKKPTTSG